MVRLKRTSPESPGWSRRRHGRGFRYVDEAGHRLSTSDVERCKALVIPPAWTDVWICTAPHGHLQAVGTDDAGRRQYIYHPKWRERRDAEKFDRIVDFADELLRRRPIARSAVRTGGFGLEQVSALTFCLLDLGMFRIGSEVYTHENGSYGLTTLDKAHVQIVGSDATFVYAAKSGQVVDVTMSDAELVEVLAALRRRRGGSDRLLAYRNGRRWHDLTADDVNSYVKELLGGDFSAKDFRTWRGTTVAALALARSQAGTPGQRRRAVSAAMREVAAHLGNTPAIARTSYVDPRLIDLFLDGVTLTASHRAAKPGAPLARGLEREVIDLLREA